MPQGIKKSRSSKPRNPENRFSSAMVHVKVGPKSQSQSFTVHKRLLCHNSSFFSCALNGGFAEAKSQTISLPDDDPYVFEAFLEWLYSGELKKASEYQDPQIWTVCVGLGVLAEKINVDELQLYALEVMRKQAVHRMREKKSDFPDKENVQHAWENTSQSSPLRSFLVLLCAFAPGMKIAGDSFPPEFLSQVADKARGEIDSVDDYYYPLTTKFGNRCDELLSPENK